MTERLNNMFPVKNSDGEITHKLDVITEYSSGYGITTIIIRRVYTNTSPQIAFKSGFYRHSYTPPKIDELTLQECDILIENILLRKGGEQVAEVFKTSKIIKGMCCELDMKYNPSSSKSLIAIISRGVFDITRDTREKVEKLTGYNAMREFGDEKTVKYRTNLNLIKVLIEKQERAFCGVFGSQVEYIEIDTCLLEYLTIRIDKTYHLCDLICRERLVFDWPKYLSKTYPTPEDIASNAGTISELLKHDIPPHNIVSFW